MILGWSTYSETQCRLLSSKGSNIKRPANIALLTVSGVLAVFFAFWQRRQEGRHKPALIPNSLWRKPAFASACIMVLSEFFSDRQAYFETDALGLQSLRGQQSL